jgi:hypothetical protein
MVSIIESKMLASTADPLVGTSPGAGDELPLVGISPGAGGAKPLIGTSPARAEAETAHPKAIAARNLFMFVFLLIEDARLLAIINHKITSRNSLQGP